jgi:hypothetical protein
MRPEAFGMKLLARNNVVMKGLKDFPLWMPMD